MNRFLIDYSIVNDYYKNSEPSIFIIGAKSKLMYKTNENDEFQILNMDKLEELNNKLIFPTKISFIDTRLSCAKK